MHCYFPRLIPPPDEIYALLTKRGGKTAGQVVFLRFYGPRRGQYPAILTEQAWSIKDLLYGQKVTPNNFAFAGTNRAMPKGQERPILPARVANQNTGFVSSSPLAHRCVSCQVRGEAKQILARSLFYLILFQ